MRLLSVKTIVLLIFLLALLSELTSFENRVSLNFAKGKVNLEVEGQSLELDLFEDPIVKINASLSRNMVAKGGLRALQIKTTDKDIRSESPFSLYLFGRLWFGQIVKPDWPSFQPSFGDWTMDRSMSQSIPIYEGSLTQPFSLNTRIAGRGSSSFSFISQNSQKVEVEIHDGFIDNCFSICIQQKCISTERNESAISNVSRIINFFSEALLLSFLFCLLLKIFGSRSYSCSGSKDIADCNVPDSGTKRKLILLALGTLVLIHFLMCAYVSSRIFGSTPHIPDSASYYRQAVVISTGKLLSDQPPRGPYQAYLSNNSKFREGRIEYMHANHFWPALLALAVKSGTAELFCPLLSCLSLILVFWIVQRLYSVKEALICSLLYCFSPFVLVMSGDYMLHIPTQTALLGSLALGIKGWEKKSLCLLVICGSLWGYAFGMRQATAVSYLASISFYLLIFYRQEIRLRQLISFLAGVCPVMILFIIDNRWVTGKWFALPHASLYGKSLSLGNFNYGANQVDSMLGYLPSICFSFPFPQLIFGLVFFGAIFSFYRQACLLLTIFLSLIGIHLFFNDTGLHGFGPRFLFESLWVLYALVAASVVVSLRALPLASKVLLSSFLTAIMTWNIYALNNILPLYKNYNGLSSDLAEKLRKFDRNKVLFLIENSGWQGMESGVTLFDPSFKSTIMISKTEDRSYLDVIKGFPNRKVVLVGFNSVSEIDRESLY